MQANTLRPPPPFPPSLRSPSPFTLPWATPSLHHSLPSSLPCSYTLPPSPPPPPPHPPQIAFIFYSTWGHAKTLAESIQANTSLAPWHSPLFLHPSSLPPSPPLDCHHLLLHLGPRQDPRRVHPSRRPSRGGRGPALPSRRNPPSGRARENARGPAPFP